VTSIPAWTADAKGLLTGAPAYTAVLAAQLAAQGITGRRDLLESPLGYFYRVADIASPRRLERAIRDLGPDWRFARQYFNKRYATASSRSGSTGTTGSATPACVRCTTRSRWFPT